MKTKKRIILICAAILILIGVGIGVFCLHQEHTDNAPEYAKPFSYSKIKGSDKPELVAHRGAAALAPENTIPAYELAAKKGFHYVETDVRVTTDGVWVLSHDANLKRMTGANVVVEESTEKEVCSYPITNGANVERYPELHTATLDEFLALCETNALTPIIEIKTKVGDYPSAPFEGILHALERYHLKDQAIVIAFDDDTLEYLRNFDSDIRLQWLVKTIDMDVLTRAGMLAPCGVDCRYQALLENPDLVQIAKQSDMPLNAWTVDNAKAAQQLSDMGVDYITTNAVYP